MLTPKSMVVPKEKRANTLKKEDFEVLNTKRKYLEDIKNCILIILFGNL